MKRAPAPKRQPDATLARQRSARVRRDPDRIADVLAEIEWVWNRFPDFTLGQLLSILADTDDLHTLDDDELVRRLRGER